MHLAGVLEPTLENRIEARRKFAEYKKCVESGKGTAHDKQLLDVFRQVKMGRKLVNLQVAMEAGGVDHRGYPKLAVANASARWAFFEWDDGTRQGEDQWTQLRMSAFYSSWETRPSWRGGWTARNKRYRFLRDTFPIRLDSMLRLRARVPTIPPRLRPDKALDKYTILWEAEWESAPTDPVLLRRVTGEWFVVLAEWDLTQVERMVLEESMLTGEF
jgi:hypothetical protein